MLNWVLSACESENLEPIGEKLVGKVCFERWNACVAHPKRVNEIIREFSILWFCSRLKTEFTAVKRSE